MENTANGSPTTEQWHQAGSMLLSWQRILLLSHDRPDGDALGSLAAMQAILRGLGHTATACLYDVIPARYAFLDQQGGFTKLSELPATEVDQRFEGILIMDTCSWSQVEPVAALLRATRLPKLVVDHHATRDDLTAASTQAQYLIDPSASSTCTMLYEWADAMHWAIPPEAGAALFAGITTDTGWFRFPSTDPRTLRVAAAIIGMGLRPDIMYARLMDSYSVARLRLLASALSTLQLHAEGRVALMHVTPEMIASAQAVPADTEDIVNEPLRSRDVIASILLVDHGDGRIRVNLRSKSPEVVGYEVDVSAVAARFGGGGHRRAAGARVEGSLQSVLTRVAAALTEVVQKSVPNN